MDGAKQSVDAADPRVQFAAERTLLAWVRTALALMGFGFVVARFGLFLRQLASISGGPPAPHPRLTPWIGTTLVALGVVISVAAAARHMHTVSRLNRGEMLQFDPLSLGTVVALLLAGAGTLLAAYLLYGS